jgi:hypothetical protein
MTMLAFLQKVFGGRSAAKPRVAGLQLEPLGERLTPSSIPNLSGAALVFDPGRELLITSEIDLGNGTGTFTGVSVNSAPGGVTTQVHGTIHRIQDILAHQHHRQQYEVSYSGISSFGPIQNGVWGSGSIVTETQPAIVLGPHHQGPIRRFTTTTYFYEGAETDATWMEFGGMATNLGGGSFFDLSGVGRLS